MIEYPRRIFELVQQIYRNLSLQLRENQAIIETSSSKWFTRSGKAQSQENPERYAALEIISLMGVNQAWNAWKHPSNCREEGTVGNGF
jgi:hypothetical protein